MKVLVLGGLGRIGSKAIEYISFLDQVDEVIIADNDLREAEKIKAGINLKIKLVYLHIQEEHQRLLQLIEEVEMVLNLAGPAYKFGSQVAKAAVDAGVSYYLDICNDYEVMKEIFSIEDRARERGVVILAGMGWSPGLTNLAVKKGCKDFSKIERVQISLCTSAADEKGFAAIAHILKSLQRRPIYIKEGKVVEVEREELDKEVVVNFPEPLGRNRVVDYVHPEPFTLARYIPDIQELNVRGGMKPTWVHKVTKGMIRCPLFKREKYLEGLASLIYRYQVLFPRGTVPFSSFRVDIEGSIENERVHKVLMMLNRKKSIVGITLATALVMLKEKPDIFPGVYAPEGCLNPDVFFARLRDSGLELIEKNRGDNDN